MPGPVNISIFEYLIWSFLIIMLWQNSTSNYSTIGMARFAMAAMLVLLCFNVTCALEHEADAEVICVDPEHDEAIVSLKEKALCIRGRTSD